MTSPNNAKSEAASAPEIMRIENQVKMEIPSEFDSLSDVHGWLWTLRIFAPFIFLLTATPWVWATVSPFATFPMWVALGVLAYKLTIVMHDCAHNTLFATKSLNQTIGKICGYILMSDFQTFRYMHWQHHMKYGAEEDPQGEDYLHLTNTSKAGLIWHILKPLFGANVYKLLAFSKGNAGVKKKKEPFVKLLKSKSYFLAMQLAIVLLITQAGQYWWLFAFLPSAALTVGLFCSQTRGFAEHIANPDGHSEAFVRTHLPNWFDKTIFYTLNFNYHVEHHLYPSVANHHLAELHKLLKKEVHVEDSLSSSIFSTISRRVDKGL